MVITSIDYSRSGKQHGYLQVPYSHNLGGWANVMVPITVVGQGDGPTALLLGGNHGDEYQGQIAIMKLCRELAPEQVPGKVIMIPSLNFPAARAAMRLSPLDGMNLNRAFPGDPNGCVTSQIAHYLTTVLFPMVDIVVDIHSGGRSMEFLPCAHMHVVADLNQRQKMLGAMLAWNTDFAFLYTDIAGTGLLPVEAENQGKIVVTTELGGGEAIPAHVHRIAYQGLRNVLMHLGVLAGRSVSREELNQKPAIITAALDATNYLLAPKSGIFEIGVELGDSVVAGQPIGYIHDLESPQNEPEVIVASKTGYLVCMRAPCLTQQGDCVAVIAQEVERSRLSDPVVDLS